MLAVTDTIHLAEQSIQDAREGVSVFNQEAFSMLLGDAEAQLSHYVKLYDQCLRGFSQSRLETSTAIDDSFWKELEDLAYHQEDRRLAKLLEKQRQPTFSAIISDVCSRLISVAGELGKPEPRVMVGEWLGTTRLRSEFRSRFTDALTHIFRNNLDHGIESPESRILKGKTEEGLIRIEACESPTGVSLWISDDGRGLNLRALRTRWLASDAVKEVTLSDDEVAELIFRSGITTAETVSMISGRGVGMDAVRCLFESMGGSCVVVLDDVSESLDGCRAFKLKIDRPATCMA
jgi:two-component system chemotaxis sensor kinase CheA